MSELDSLDGYFEISHSRGSTPAEELAAAAEERNYPVAYSMLRRLDGLLSGWDARDCLTGALSCTPRLFGAILECCEPGEYAVTDISVPYPERQDRQLLVSGTLLTLAAAMDRPEHMAILLEKGWDINSAAPASEQALYDMYNPMMFQETGWRRPDSEIRCCAREGDDAETVPEWQILRATPLAAAIVAGSLGAIRLLRAHGGVKGTEHPAVSCAAAEALHGTRRQRECLRLALGASQPSGRRRRHGTGAACQSCAGGGSRCGFRHDRGILLAAGGPRGRTVAAAEQKRESGVPACNVDAAHRRGGMLQSTAPCWLGRRRGVAAISRGR